MNKISQYFSTFELTRALLIALFSSAFIYLDHWGFSYLMINTILGILTLYLLLQEGQKVWFLSGTFIGFFWFWWIALSLQHYGYMWAIPAEILIISVIYGVLFLAFAWSAEKLSHTLTVPSVFLKAFFLLILSYIHPFGFDWLKPELMFVESYLGILKWQFSLILLACTLSIWKKQFLYLFIIVFAYQPPLTSNTALSYEIKLVTTHTPVEAKWNEIMHPEQFEEVFSEIDKAIDEGKN